MTRQDTHFCKGLEAATQCGWSSQGEGGDSDGGGEGGGEEKGSSMHRRRGNLNQHTKLPRGLGSRAMHA
jgi:hypothetical protein